MKSLSSVALLLLTLLALVLLHPSHSSPLPTPGTSRPLPPSPLNRHLLSRNDSQHDTEERIENSNEQQARDMQQQYQEDQQQQQQQQQKQQQKNHTTHKHHTQGHNKKEDVDRDAVVTGDQLRHPRDPKQQQQQQQQVIHNGTRTPPPSEQRDERRDEEADKADKADDLARSAEGQRADQPQGEVNVDADEVSNGTNVTAQNNGTAPLGETHPYDHNTQKAGTYNRTSSAAPHHAGKHHGSHNRTGASNHTDGRLDQRSPYHSEDPQARTWSQQQRVPPKGAPANFTAPPPPNSTYPSPSNPPPYDPAYQQQQQQHQHPQQSQQPPSTPQPVPTVDHAQQLVDEASGSDVLESNSGSDADDEYDSQATQNSTSSSVANRDDEEDAVISEEGSTGASNSTDAPLQEPGNNVQWNVLSERRHHTDSDDDRDDESNIAEDIHNKNNGGNRLRNEPRAGKHSHTDDERKSERQHDKNNGRHHLNGELTHSPSHADVGMADVDEAVSGKGVGSVSVWVAVLLVLCGAGFGVGWWLRRVQQQQKYEPVEQYDAYGDIVEEESEAEFEPQRVQVRVY